MAGRGVAPAAGQKRLTSGVRWLDGEARVGKARDVSESPFRVVHTPYVPKTDAEGRSLSKAQPYPPMVNPCRLCKARCCYTAVKASLPDVLRLCHTLEIPFFSAFTFEHSSDRVRGLRLDLDPRVMNPEDGWPGLGEIRMRRGNGGGCIGLVDLAGHERCGLYGARPMNCRLYPASWEDERGRGGPNAVLCPAPFAITPTVAAQIEEDSVTARTDWDIHESVVGAWNETETEATLEAALGFVLPRTAEALEVPLNPVVMARGTVDQRLTGELSSRGMIPDVPVREPVPFAGLHPTGRPR